VLLLAGAVRPPAAAATWRCGKRLVGVGDSVGQVLARCGGPSYQNESLEAVTVRISPLEKLTRFVSVERWIYDRGPHEFVRELTFRDGILAHIAELGYGE
jgi:hypothetical protein